MQFFFVSTNFFSSDVKVVPARVEVGSRNDRSSNDIANNNEPNLSPLNGTNFN